jgi:hypothetical protein
MPTLTTPIQYNPGIPKQKNKARERNKRNMNSEESQNVPICRHDAISQRPKKLHPKYS